MSEALQAIYDRIEATGVITPADRQAVQAEFDRMWQKIAPYLPLAILYQHQKRAIWLAAFCALPVPQEGASDA